MKRAISSLPTDAIRVAIADDHELARVGLYRMLSSDSSVEIVGEASDGDQLLALVEKQKPDVVFLDIFMPRRNGLETARELRSRIPTGKPYIIMLTTFEDYSYLQQALAIGADGYLSKDVSRQELLSSLRSVVKGERVFSRSILALMQGMRSKHSAESLSTVTLTKREEEILELVAQGLTSNEIADRLFISPRTVETHRAHLMEKLGAKNAAALVRYAILHSIYFPGHGRPSNASSAESAC
ncbi:MAG: putative transcriptional regulatory protein YxjL [Candidatus Kapaibacterium sp.]|nr:MAG: putative transcriptional regulatory protein YxjL [Candidatus Kapabacteria bacterium]